MTIGKNPDISSHRGKTGKLKPALYFSADFDEKNNHILIIIVGF